MAGSNQRLRLFQKRDLVGDTGVLHLDQVWCCYNCRDAEEVWVGGDRVQYATKWHTWHQDAQDAKEANLTSLASGCKVDASEAT